MLPPHSPATCPQPPTVTYISTNKWPGCPYPSPSRGRRALTWCYPRRLAMGLSVSSIHGREGCAKLIPLAVGLG